MASQIYKFQKDKEPYSLLSQQKWFLHALKRKNLGAKDDFRHPLPLNHSKCYRPDHSIIYRSTTEDVTAWPQYYLQVNHRRCYSPDHSIIYSQTTACLQGRPQSLLQSLLFTAKPQPVYRVDHSLCYSPFTNFKRTRNRILYCLNKNDSYTL